MQKQEVKIIELEKQLQGREMAEKKLVKQKTVREFIFCVMFNLLEALLFSGVRDVSIGAEEHSGEKV